MRCHQAIAALLLVASGPLLLAGCGSGSGGSSGVYGDPYPLTWYYQEGATARSVGTYHVELENAAGYVSLETDGQVVETDTVLRAEELAGRATWVVTSTMRLVGGLLDGRQSTITQWLHAPPEALWCCAYAEGDTTPYVFPEPLLCLPNPLVPGEYFTPTGAFPRQQAQGRLISCTARAMRREVVSAPIGRMEAMRIEGASETVETDALGQTTNTDSVQVYWMEATLGTLRSSQRSIAHYAEGGRSISQVELALESSSAPGRTPAPGTMSRAGIMLSRLAAQMRAR